MSDLSLQSSSLNTSESSPQDAQVVGGHTKTPWEIDTREPGEIWVSSASPRRPVCMITASGFPTDRDRADAAFIVKAVNSHETLMKVYEAAKSLSAFCDTINIQISEADRVPLKAAWDKLDAALSSLKEGK